MKEHFKLVMEKRPNKIHVFVQSESVLICHLFDKKSRSYHAEIPENFAMVRKKSENVFLYPIY